MSATRRTGSGTNEELETRIDDLLDRIIFLEGAVTALRDATLGVGEPHPFTPTELSTNDDQDPQS